MFLAFSVEKDRLLKVLLIIHGIIGVSGFIVPLLPFLYSASDNSSDNIGSIALMGWCVLFIPICVLFVRYFIRKLKSI